MPRSASSTPPHRPPAARSPTSGARSSIVPGSPACSPAAPPPSPSNAPPNAAEENSMSKHHVSTTINDEPLEFLCEPQETLLDVLRNTLGLTGTKEGCASGDCGACSVILDGRLVASCLVLAAEAQGRRVTTIEGI